MTEDCQQLYFHSPCSEPAEPGEMYCAMHLLENDVWSRADYEYDLRSESGVGWWSE